MPVLKNVSVEFKSLDEMRDDVGFRENIYPRPTASHLTSAGMIGTNALCSWKLDSDIKENRIPNEIKHAVCDVNMPQNTLKTYDFSSVVCQCKPFVYPLNVLEWTCQGDSDINWTFKQEDVRVGCACAKTNG